MNQTIVEALEQPGTAVIDTPEFTSKLTSSLATALEKLDGPAEPPTRRSSSRGDVRQRAKGSRHRVLRTPAALDRKSLEQLVGEAVRNTVVYTTNLDRVLDPGALALYGEIVRILPDVRAQHSEAAIEKLIDALVETHDPLTRTTRQIDAANARVRIRFIETVATLTSDEIAEGAGHAARNKSMTASRWKADGKIFSVRWQGQERYPSFQFADGRPLPVIKDVLSALPEGLSAWEVAFWFVSSNPWLDGQAPHDVIGMRDRVVQAARMLSENVIA